MMMICMMVMILFSKREMDGDDDLLLWGMG